MSARISTPRTPAGAVPKTPVGVVISTAVVLRARDPNVGILMTRGLKVGILRARSLKVRILRARGLKVRILKARGLRMWVLGAAWVAIRVKSALFAIGSRKVCGELVLIFGVRNEQDTPGSPGRPVRGAFRAPDFVSPAA